MVPSQTDWGSANNDLFELKTGYLAEDWSWKLDEAKDEGTVVYQIRQGVHWALNPNSEASRLVNGREMTADDVVFSAQRSFTWNLAFLYGYYTEMRNLPVTKTGPWEVTIKIPGANNLITLVSRTADGMFIVPPEVVDKYGDMSSWKNREGTGPFMFTEYVSGSQMVFARNPNYWMKDPIGPGKGNQLPYLDSVRILILPDASTRQAALRTGKVDNMFGVSREDGARLKQTTPQLVSKMYTSNQGRGTPLGMRLDKPELSWAPQDDPNALKVRRAMMMAIDFKGILDSLYGGVGQIVTFPFSYVKE